MSWKRQLQDVTHTSTSHFFGIIPRKNTVAEVKWVSGMCICEGESFWRGLCQPLPAAFYQEIQKRNYSQARLAIFSLTHYEKRRVLSI
jgi:hypothetical protein